jgi:hypothetical protein
VLASPKYHHPDLIALLLPLGVRLCHSPVQLLAGTVAYVCGTMARFSQSSFNSTAQLTSLGAQPQAPKLFARRVLLLSAGRSLPTMLHKPPHIAPIEMRNHARPGSATRLYPCSLADVACFSCFVVFAILLQSAGELSPASDGIVSAETRGTSPFHRDCTAPFHAVLLQGFGGSPLTSDSFMLPPLRRVLPCVAFAVLLQGVGESPLASDGFMLLRGPVRGGLAAATAGGRVLLLDSRTKWQVGAPAGLPYQVMHLIAGLLGPRGGGVRATWSGRGVQQLHSLLAL